MKVVEQQPNFLVVDDFLPSSQFDRLAAYVDTEDYSFVQVDEWQRVWRLHDGRPLEGPLFLSRAPDGSRYPAYPTGKPIDILFEALTDHVDLFRQQVGEDWDLFTARPFLYPAETGLSWHVDQDNSQTMLRTGAYTYYTHRSWNVLWGGELMISREREAQDCGILDNQAENASLMQDGFGHYVLARPNRLVVLAGWAPHRIARVDRCAGHHVRSSISGFFLKIPEESA
ncbi:MAG: 2OG-Fe(II) oxygenase [Vulcanimicrobiota bacterium]